MHFMFDYRVIQLEPHPQHLMDHDRRFRLGLLERGEGG